MRAVEQLVVINVEEEVDAAQAEAEAEFESEAGAFFTTTSIESRSSRLVQVGKTVPLSGTLGDCLVRTHRAQHMAAHRSNNPRSIFGSWTV